MTERHLILQETILSPSAEWIPRNHGWLMVRVAEGVGYWMQSGAPARELSVGDGLVVARNSQGVLRTSQLGALKLQFFIVQPQHLNGLLAVTEWHQLEVAPDNLASYVAVFTASDTIGQRFTRISHQSQNDQLTVRCALLQLWANAVADLLPAPPLLINENKLRERFRRLVGQMTEAELSECPLSELAGRLHCSERHFSRLFREEFGVPLRARQIELRLQRARQLLAETDAKIINVAYDSGYRHLGLFNTMFKKRFGVTPSEWRRQSARKSPAPARAILSRVTVILWFVLGLFVLPARGQSADDGAASSAPGAAPPSSSARFVDEPRELAKTAQKKTADAAAAPAKHADAAPVQGKGPHFNVDKYLVTGNSLLSPETIGGLVTNAPDAFGTNVSFENIRAVLAGLQMAYRERGYVTVSVGLPQQRLTNAEVKVKVTEGRLAAINVVGNRYYSSNNIMRALPSLHTNLLLNSHVFQRELDVANANRDRQIYPVIGPGPDPGTSELTLKVKDRLPLHARLEVNNQATPGTPDTRVNFNAQYGNLWDQEHQAGIQYNFVPDRYKAVPWFVDTPFDTPLVSSYSAYYRLPLGGYSSVEEKIEDHPTSFGYNEVTHQFQLPPPSDRPALTMYAARSVSDTGLIYPPPGFAVSNATFSIATNNAGEVVTLNEDLGARFSFPLPAVSGARGSLFFGLDYKNFESLSFQTNNFFVHFEVSSSPPTFVDTNVAEAQPVMFNHVRYLPLNAGLNFSIPDKHGVTVFNGQVNVGLPLSAQLVTSTNMFATRSNSVVNAHTHYVTIQAGVGREWKMSDNWSIKMRVDGQWADVPLISNEMFGMGGTMGVRGYTDGEAYGDDGWRLTLEPQTRLFNIGSIGNEGRAETCWLRSSVFLDYGEVYILGPTSGKDRQSFCGAGWTLTANLGSHVDGRLTVGYPLIRDTLVPTGTRAGDVHIYFGVGGQF